MPVIASNNFLEDLAFVLSVAAAVTVIFQALRQPVVVGYLVAGMLVGPYLPFPLFADIERIHILSELGVILLMFALGLEFSVRRLAQLAPTAGFITVVQVGLLMWLGYEVGRALGWTELEGVFTGAILSISSTTIVIKAFAEQQVDKQLSELVFGVALFEDLAAVIILAVLTALATGAGLSIRMIGVTVGQLVLFLAALIGAGLLIVPPAIRIAASFKRAETLIVASVGLSFAIAMIAELAGYSVALGAFLAGVMVAESGQAPAVEHLVAPLRDIFGAIFFVSVGMTLDPRVIVAHWPALLALLAVVLAGKIVGVGVGATLSGNSTRLAVQAGMSMAQIGEFSFIIAAAGVEHRATRSFLYSLAIAVSAITTFTTPFMIRASDRVGRFVDAHLPRSIGVLQSIYDWWTEQMRARPHPRDYRGAIAFIALAIGAVITVAIAYAVLAGRLRIVVAAATGFSPDAATLIVRAVALGLAAVPGVAVWRGAHRLAQKIASSIAAASASPDQSAEVDLTRSNLLAGVFEIAIIFGAVTVIFAIIAPFMSPLEGLAVMLLALAVLAIVIGRNARQLYAQVLAAPSAEFAGTSDGIGPLIHVSIPEGSAVVGSSLSDLNLHAATGAMVMAIVRDGRRIPLPGGSEVLEAGDTIALVGSSAAIAAARDLITTPAIPEPQLTATPADLETR